MATPRKLAEKRLQLAVEYVNTGEKLAQIKVKKAEEVVKLRASCKSYSEAERLWEITEDGKNEIILSFKLKGIEKLLSAIKGKLDVANLEARNQV